MIVLDDECMFDFTHSCFGFYVTFHVLRLSGDLIHHLCMRMLDPNDNVMEFNLGGVEICSFEREFAFVTELSFSNKLEDNDNEIQRKSDHYHYPLRELKSSSNVNNRFMG